MRSPVFVSVKKCARCELLYLETEPHCTHCKELSEPEVIALKNQYEKESLGNAALGKKLYFAAFVLLLFIIIINVE